MKINLLFITSGIALFTLITGFDRPRSVNIVFIGDSITYGAGLGNTRKQAPPVIASLMLQHEQGIGMVKYANQGRSGFTTADFLPLVNTAFAGVESAARSFSGSNGLLVFSIMLGTNDSAITGPNGAPVSKEQYRQNLKLITGRLLKDFPNALIIINRPLWYSPNTYNGAKYLQEGLTRLQSYFPEIDALIKDFNRASPGHIFKGDQDAFNFFKRHHKQYLQPETGHEGVFFLHPNEKGAMVLAEYWEKSIYKLFKTFNHRDD